MTKARERLRNDGRKEGGEPKNEKAKRKSLDVKHKTANSKRPAPRRRAEVQWRELG